jgi:nucleotide-binding universal stress UspA family protein
MQEIKRILFPVDGSETCRRFASAVRCVACRTGARITVLNTLELPSNDRSDRATFLSLVDVRAMMRQRRAEIRKTMQSELADLPDVVAVFRHGDPARSIVEFAHRRNADLIMMPTHGLGPFRRFLIGSVTAKVLHDAKCPVWTSAHTPEHPQTERVSRVLCAVDLGEKSIPVMQYARWLAGTFGAQLRFLNVVAVSESWTVRYFESEFVATLVDQAHKQLQIAANQVESTAESVVRSGDIASSVRREAIEWRADLIVIGRGVLGESLGRLRTETYGVICESPCPVVSV